MGQKDNILCILPVYNEQDTVGSVIDFVKLLYNKKIIQDILIVNDASADQSQNIIQNKQKALQKVLSLNFISNDTNKGKGFALRHGYEQAKAQKDSILFMMDTDLLQLPEQGFEHLLEPLQSGEYMRILPHFEGHISSYPHSISISGERILDIHVIDKFIELVGYEQARSIIVTIRFGLEEFLNYIVEKMYGKYAIDIIEYNDLEKDNYPLAKPPYKSNSIYQDQQLSERLRFRNEIKPLLEKIL